MTRAWTTPPDLAELEAIAIEAFQTIPAELRRHVASVPIRIAEFPDDRTMADMGLDSPFDLLGLYRGVDLIRKSVNDVRQDVDMIFLYRRPLLDYWCETGEELTRIVRHVLIHEIGHHFGLSDADMDALEREAEAAGPAGAP